MIIINMHNPAYFQYNNLYITCLVTVYIIVMCNYWLINQDFDQKNNL